MEFPYFGSPTARLVAFFFALFALFAPFRSSSAFLDLKRVMGYFKRI
jgi:hypothetical protein